MKRLKRKTLEYLGIGTLGSLVGGITVSLITTKSNRDVYEDIKSFKKDLKEAQSVEKRIKEENDITKELCESMKKHIEEKVDLTEKAATATILKTDKMQLKLNAMREDLDTANNAIIKSIDEWQKYMSQKSDEVVQGFTSQIEHKNKKNK